MIIFLLIWFISGLLAYAIVLDTFTKEFPYMNHMAISSLFFIAGVFGLIAAPICLLLEGEIRKIGLRFRPISYEERKKIFYDTYPNLDAKYFERHYPR